MGVMMQGSVVGVKVPVSVLSDAWSAPVSRPPPSRAAPDPPQAPETATSQNASTARFTLRRISVLSPWAKARFRRGRPKDARRGRDIRGFKSDLAVVGKSGVAPGR